MLNNLLPHLSTLIVTVRRNMLSSVMTTFMILAIIIVWSARGNIATWFEQNPSVHEKSQRIVRSAESDKKIEAQLKRDLVKLNGDRVLIRRFSDQIDEQTGTKIPYVTTTHIVTAPGVSMPPAQLTNIPRSYISDVTSRVFATPGQPVCVRVKTTEIKDEIYHRLLVEGGVQEQYVCPIVDIDGAPIGLIMASYITLDKPNPTDEEIFQQLSLTATRVAGYIAEVTAPERQAWYRQLLDSGQ